jgi:hypothetical protein
MLANVLQDCCNTFIEAWLSDVPQKGRRVETLRPMRHDRLSPFGSGLVLFGLFAVSKGQRSHTNEKPRAWPKDRII